MKYVMGIDLGTSSVKVIVMDRNGDVIAEVSRSYPLIQQKVGYSEQDPEKWVEQTKKAITDLMFQFPHMKDDIAGISFSGQMHGLVLLDKNKKVLRNAILWNDTRTKLQCDFLTKEFGEKILSITKNTVLEGFTLPKLLWVKENEPEIFEKANVFLLPKDYVRYRMTGEINTDYSDAAGTLLLDVEKRKWSKELCELSKIDPKMCPPLVESFSLVGTLQKEFAEQVGLSEKVKVFAGGADNACGAVGAGVLSEKYTLSSIGTSGVILSYDSDVDQFPDGTVHTFNHAKSNGYYSMGVTLSAGESLSWFKKTFAPNKSFSQVVTAIEDIPVSSEGLLFTPYLFGERTPHPDAYIRGSFIGISASHTKAHFTRAVMEGITFSLNESVEILRDKGKQIGTVISIGGGAKSDLWLQMQADIFNTDVASIQNEQGPGLGAAIIAAYGLGWFGSLEEGAKNSMQIKTTFFPIEENVTMYKQLFSVYKSVYEQTKAINYQLMEFRDK